MKKIGFIAITSLYLALGLFTSCEKEKSSDVNQDKIYTDYEVFYDRNTDKSWVVAKFRFGGPTGTILELDSTAVVRFNNDTLAYNALFTGHFKEYAGRITTGTFTYTNVAGQVFQNSIPVCDTIAFPTTLNSLSKSSAHQAVGIFIGSWSWGQNALAYQDADGATNLVLGINQMAALALGSSTVYMDRQTEVSVSQGTSEGGKIRSKYRALNIVLQVVN
jgi:hypothetical protein